MVSDTVIGAVIGVSGAVVGSFLTGIFNWITTTQRIQAENNRRHAEFYMENKVEKLNEVHSKLTEAQQWIGVASLAQQNNGEPPTDRTGGETISLDELYEIVKSLQLSIGNASIYLTSEQKTILRGTVSDLWDAYSRLDNEEEVIEDKHVASLLASTEVALEILSEEMCGPIEELESN